MIDRLLVAIFALTYGAIVIRLIQVERRLAKLEQKSEDIFKQ